MGMRLKKSSRMAGLVAISGFVLSLFFVNMSPSKPWLPGTGLIDYTFEFQGRQRRFLMYIPKNLPRDRKAPVVFVLHGGGGSAERMREGVTLKTFESLADQRGFIVIYPEAVREPGESGGHWNDGRDLDYKSHRENVDDVGFIDGLITSAGEDFLGYDLSRIYVVGASNGGMMAQRLACRIGHRLAAVASVVAALPKNIQTECAQSPAVPILLMNGTADPIMQWHSGFVHDPLGRPMLGERLTVPQTREYWRQKNGCSNQSAQHSFKDINKTDRSTVSKEDFMCANNMGLAMYTVTGGGHTWPGGGTAAMGAAAGPVNKDISATREIMDFMSRFTADR